MAQLLTMEYFFGLELVRPIILWMLMREKGEKLPRTALKVLRYWAPYLLPLTIFILIRFVFSAQLFPLLDANPALLLMRMKSQPVSEMINLLEIAIKDSLTSGCLPGCIPSARRISAWTALPASSRGCWGEPPPQ